MAKINLYVPDDLKTRMDEIGEAINWSALAQRAFLDAVQIHAIRKDESNMTDVVERMRASKKRYEEEQREAGMETGARWAREDAEYEELLRVATCEDPVDGDELQRILDPENTGDSDYWESLWGADEPSDAFAEGFIAAATKVYNEIADKL